MTFDASAPLAGAIDVHAHYVTPRLREAMIAAGHDRPDGMPAIPEWTADIALSEMDLTGITAAMLSVSSPGVHFGDDGAARDLARVVNDEGSALVAAHPHRFGLLASLPLPDFTGALVELHRAFDELGADGIVLLTRYGDHPLGDERYEPLLAELDRRAAVVLLHPTSPPCREALGGGMPAPMLEFPFETTRAVASLVLSGVLRRYPAIRFVVPHAGAALPALADRIAVFAGASGDPWVDVLAALRGLYYDVAGFALPRQLPALLTLTTPDRLLYGSDHPFTPGVAVRVLARALVESDVLSSDELRMVRHGTAARLFPRFAP